MSNDDMRQAALARRRAIRECQLCDDFGWLLGTDRLPLDPARKCRHGQPSLYHQH